MLNKIKKFGSFKNRPSRLVDIADDSQAMPLLTSMINEQLKHNQIEQNIKEIYIVSVATNNAVFFEDLIFFCDKLIKKKICRAIFSASIWSKSFLLTLFLSVKLKFSVFLY